MEEKYYAVTRKDSNDLQHWKYIKREYDSDKRRYKYTYKKTNAKNIENYGLVNDIKNHIKDAMGYDEQAAYETMKNTVNMHKDMIKIRNAERKHILEGTNGWDKYPDEYKPGFIKNMIDADNEFERRSLKSAEKVYKQALDSYKKTPLYKIKKNRKNYQKRR